MPRHAFTTWKILAVFCGIFLSSAAAIRHRIMLGKRTVMRADERLLQQHSTRRRHLRHAAAMNINP